MSVAQAKRVGIVAGAVLSVFGVIALARPVLNSDTPPWASKVAVNDKAAMIYDEIGKATREILSRLVAGNILAINTRYCEAMRAGQIAYAQTLSDTVSMLQAEYRSYAGYDYTVPRCP